MLVRPVPGPGQRPLAGQERIAVQLRQDGSGVAPLPHPLVQVHLARQFLLEQEPSSVGAQRLEEALQRRRRHRTGLGDNQVRQIGRQRQLCIALVDRHPLPVEAGLGERLPRRPHARGVGIDDDRPQARLLRHPGMNDFVHPRILHQLAQGVRRQAQHLRLFLGDGRGGARRSGES